MVEGGCFLKSIKFVFLLYVTINGNKMLVYIFTFVFSKEKSAKKVEARIENGQKKMSKIEKSKIIFEKRVFFRVVRRMLTKIF